MFLHPTSVSLPAAIVTSSVSTSVAGHVMYHSPPAVMYTSTPTLADGSGLAVLNAFSQAPPSMQVSHAQAQDTGEPPLPSEAPWAWDPTAFRLFISQFA